MEKSDIQTQLAAMTVNFETGEISVTAKVTYSVDHGRGVVTSGLSRRMSKTVVDREACEALQGQFLPLAAEDASKLVEGD